MSLEECVAEVNMWRHATAEFHCVGMTGLHAGWANAAQTSGSTLHPVPGWGRRGQMVSFSTPWRRIKSRVGRESDGLREGVTTRQMVRYEDVQSPYKVHSRL
jgi:hypothetical protein